MGYDIEDTGDVDSHHVRSIPTLGGQDYSLDIRTPDYAYIDEEGKAVSIEYKEGDPNCCRKIFVTGTWTDYSWSWFSFKCNDACNKLKEDVKKRSKDQEKDDKYNTKALIHRKNQARSARKSFTTLLHSWHKKTKRYNQKTIELGVYVDSALYQKIQKIVSKKDDKMVRKKIEEFVHDIFVKVEVLLTHKSFSTIKGGFKVLINDLIILKDDMPISAQLSKQNTVKDLLSKFQELVDDFDNKRRKSEKVEMSIDARYLLTGREKGHSYRYYFWSS